MSFPTEKNSLIKTFGFSLLWCYNTFSSPPPPQLYTLWNLEITLYNSFLAKYSTWTILLRWQPGGQRERLVKQPWKTRDPGYRPQLITAKSDVSGGMSESGLGDLSHGEARRGEKRSGGKSFTWVRDRRASVWPKTKGGMSKGGSCGAAALRSDV